MRKFIVFVLFWLMVLFFLWALPAEAKAAISGLFQDGPYQPEYPLYVPLVQEGRAPGVVPVLPFSAILATEQAKLMPPKPTMPVNCQRPPECGDEPCVYTCPEAGGLGVVITLTPTPSPVPTWTPSPTRTPGPTVTPVPTGLWPFPYPGPE